MRILVTFAVEAEFAPWRKRHPFEKRKLPVQTFSTNEQTVYTTKVGGSIFDVLLTGIGWDRFAGSTARHGLRALLKEEPDVCISTGLAGALKPAYRRSDVVVAAEVGRYGQTCLARSDNKLVKIAQGCGAKLAQRLITWNQIVGDSKAKKAMGIFADVVDMETFFVMSAVSGARVPSVAVRAISDACDEDLPIDFSQVLDRQGNIKTKKLISALSRQPGRIPALVRFGRRSAAAAERLADFLDIFAVAIGEQFARPRERHEQVAAK